MSLELFKDVRKAFRFRLTLWYSVFFTVTVLSFFCLLSFSRLLTR